MARLGEAVLGAMSSAVPILDGESGADENPLALLEREYPDLRSLVAGKRVLDFGCGYGHQTAALASRYGCNVVGLDVDQHRLAIARARYQQTRFVSYLDNDRFDVILSQNSMEHFPNPSGVLSQMRSLLAPSGRILITFGPPWWAPYGSHMQYFCRLPWLQLWFSERTIMTVRKKYNADGATRFSECLGGLNQMSLRKFSLATKQASLQIERLELRGVRRQHWLTHVPLLRELFTTHATAILR